MSDRLASSHAACSLYIARTYFVSTFRNGVVMSKDAVFTMKLEPELRDEFMAEASALDRPASQIMRDLMREFVQRQREAREYDAFLRRKVEVARRSMRAGRGHSNEEVEAEAVRARAELLRRADEAGE